MTKQSDDGFFGYIGKGGVLRYVNVTATASDLIPGDECEVDVENGSQINAGSIPPLQQA